MTTALPYLSAPGTVGTLLERIKTAAVPTKVDKGVMETVFGLKGGSGAACIPFLKRIGFLKADGEPTDIYKNFRNAKLSGAAIYEAMKYGYAPLYASNEKIHEANPADLKGAIIHVTGLEQSSRAVELMAGCFSALKKIAVFTEMPAAAAAAKTEPEKTGGNEQPAGSRGGSHGIKLGMSYTIYLNLPNTSDPAVFNAIFKALRENLAEK